MPQTYVASGHDIIPDPNELLPARHGSLLTEMGPVRDDLSVRTIMGRRFFKGLRSTLRDRLEAARVLGASSFAGS